MLGKKSKMSYLATTFLFAAAVFQIKARMFSAPGAAVVTVPRSELARKAGRQYAETGAIDEALLADDSRRKVRSHRERRRT